MKIPMFNEDTKLLELPFTKIGKGKGKISRSLL